MVGAVVMVAMSLMAAVAPSPSIRIGVIDTRRIEAESSAVRTMLEQADERAAKIRDSLQKSRNELSARLQAYSSQGGVITSEERDRREEAILSLREQVDVLEFRLERESRMARERSVGPVGQRVLDAVRQVSEEHGVTLVLESHDVVRYEAVHDITDLVIGKLDM